MPYSEKIDDAEGNEGSDSTDIEVLSSKKKRVIDNDDSDDDGLLWFSMKVLLVRVETETETNAAWLVEVIASKRLRKL